MCPDIEIIKTIGLYIVLPIAAVVYALIVINSKG